MYICIINMYIYIHMMFCDVSRLLRSFGGLTRPEGARSWEDHGAWGAGRHVPIVWWLAVAKCFSDVGAKSNAIMQYVSTVIYMCYMSLVSFCTWQDYWAMLSGGCDTIVQVPLEREALRVCSDYSVQTKESLDVHSRPFGESIGKAGIWTCTTLQKQM